MRFKFFLPLLLLLAVVGWSAKASAHGTQMQYRKVEAVEIDAAYEGGEPMANAQVRVYTPDDQSTPWKTATTDEQGRFSFVPDQSKPGNWEVMIRQAGHGEIINIPVESAANAEELNQSEKVISQTNLSSGGQTQLQRVLLGAAGVWGFVGTALFFARRKTD